MDFKALLKEIQNKNFKPIYALHGEEPYYIDLLCDAIIKHALNDEERDFNQSIFYGRDADLQTLISEAKGYPLMAERRLVVLREAQDFKDIYELEHYCSNLSDSTVFVICFKYKNLDGKRKLVKEIATKGVVFKSEKVRDYQLVTWITDYVKSVGFDITSKASALLSDFLGNDLSRIVNELDKLAIVLEPGTRVSDVHIEENIGISKDYNVFELTNALAKRDTAKVFTIAHYFSKNPKDHSIVMIIPQLFKLYSNLMRVHFSPNKNPDYLAKTMGVHPFFVKDYLNQAQTHSPKVLANNVAILHEYDLKSKGVGNSTVSDGELLKELLFQLMN